MKKNVLALLMLLAIGSVSVDVNGQTHEPLIMKDWQMLGESLSHIDVSYRIVNCNDKSQVHLKLLSESDKNETISFDIGITNKLDGKSLSKSFTVAINSMQKVQATCLNADGDLAIVLPESYYVMNLDVTITFK